MKEFYLLDYSYLTKCRPSLKSSKMGIKDAQCAETYEKNDPNFIYREMVDFTLKIIRKFTKVST